MNDEQGFKHHNRNGVVFCMSESEVYVTCMDCECNNTLATKRESYLVMARELEQIHVRSKYDASYEYKPWQYTQRVLDSSEMKMLHDEADKKKRERKKAGKNGNEVATVS